MISRGSAVQRLFKSWLLVVHTQTALDDSEGLFCFVFCFLQDISVSRTQGRENRLFIIKTSLPLDARRAVMTVERERERNNIPLGRAVSV